MNYYNEKAIERHKERLAERDAAKAYEDAAYATLRKEVQHER